MKNGEIAKLFRRMALLLEINGDLIFKIRAYERAALTLENLDEDIKDIWKQGTLDSLAGIGEKLKGKIIEYLETGKIESFEKKKKKIPINLDELDTVPGLGPKTILKLYKRFKVKNLDDLKKAAEQHKIQTIKGLGPVVEQNILRNISFAKQSTGRVPLGIALNTAEKLAEALNGSKTAITVKVAGSIRRMKETIGDIDILASSGDPAKAMEFFSSMENVDKVIAKGATKCSVMLKGGIQADLRILNEEIFGAGLIYFTGSQQHNIQLRRVAIEKGLKLSEYGLFDKKTNSLVAGKTEEEVYKKLGMNFIEPEMREDGGEIELAQHRMLPKIVDYNEIKGDLQVHTNWSDGTNTIEEMTLAAKALGYEYICITDHVGKFAYANALDAKRILEQKKEIEDVNKKVKGITVLQGGEVNITADGALDMDDNVLKGLDIVVAAIHSGFNSSKENLTKRMVKAMQNENIDIIGHPTGRILGKRESYELDFETIFDTAKETGTALEINANLKRLDLKDSNIKAAVKAKVKLSLGTDAHSTDQLHFMRLGVGTGRRGWATSEDIINTRNLKDLMKLIKHKS